MSSGSEGVPRVPWHVLLKRQQQQQQSASSKQVQCVQWPVQ
jgi:hypothetical protein